MPKPLDRTDAHNIAKVLNGIGFFAQIRKESGMWQVLVTHPNNQHTTINEIDTAEQMFEEMFGVAEKYFFSGLDKNK